MHLIIDGYGSDSTLLQDEQFIYQLLDTYPELIGMTKISAPFVTRYIGPNPKDWGISGFVFIAESHISIHTFVERCLVNIDVFSCKSFDAEQAVKYFKDKLHLTRLATCLIKRKLSPAELPEADDMSQLQLV